MTRTQRLLSRLNEVLGSFSSPLLPSENDTKAHTMTHKLTHADAVRTAKEHGEKIRAGLREKNLPKTYVDDVVKTASTSMYLKHYNRAYPNTKREVRRHILSNP